jgi:hypothetical protein
LTRAGAEWDEAILDAVERSRTFLLILSACANQSAFVKNELNRAISSVSGATLVPGAPVRLFPTHIVGGGADAGQGRQYDIAPDGRFLINTELESTAAPITLIQNWKPEPSKQ